MIYESARIKIKPLMERIINNGNYRDWLHDPEITKFSSHGIYTLTEEGIQIYLKQANNHENITWAIISLAHEEYIGNIALQEINYINRSAELAILIGEKDYWGKGIATEACQLVIKHAFEKVNLRRIWLGTPELNKGMINVAKKLNMEIEGRFIKEFWHKNKYIDILRYSIIKEE